MDLTQFFQFASVAVGVIGIFIAGFWRMWGLIRDVRTEGAGRGDAAVELAAEVRKELHAHQLHVARNFVSKEGLREQTGQIMDAIGTIGAQLSSMNGRIDRMLERPPTPRAAPRS